MVIGAMLSRDAKVPEIYEAFPFWTDAEIREMKLEQYKALMQRVTAKKGVSADAG